MIFISLVLSQKILTDFSDGEVIISGICTKEEFCIMEEYFLRKIDYRIFIDATQFSDYCEYVLNYSKQTKFDSEI